MKNDRIEWSGVDRKLRSYLKKGENYERYSNRYSEPQKCEGI